MRMMMVVVMVMVMMVMVMGLQPFETTKQYGYMCVKSTNLG